MYLLSTVLDFAWRIELFAFFISAVFATFLLNEVFHYKNLNRLEIDRIYMKLLTLLGKPSMFCSFTLIFLDPKWQTSNTSELRNSTPWSTFISSLSTSKICYDDKFQLCNQFLQIDTFFKLSQCKSLDTAADISFSTTSYI